MVLHGVSCVPEIPVHVKIFMVVHEAPRPYPGVTSCNVTRYFEELHDGAW